MNQVLDSESFIPESGVYTASRESLEARSLRGSASNVRRLNSTAKKADETDSLMMESIDEGGLVNAMI